MKNQMIRREASQCVDILVSRKGTNRALKIAVMNPHFARGDKKSHYFRMRHLTPWNNWKSPIWFQEPPCKQFTVQGSASQTTQCPKPESVMVCHRTCGLVSGAFDANWSCYIKHLAPHLQSQGNILPGRSGTVTSPLPKKCQVWFPPLWHEWSESLQQEYPRQFSVPQVTAWWATSDALQTKVSLITGKKPGLFVVSAGRHVKPCFKLLCDFWLVQSTIRKNAFVSEWLQHQGNHLQTKKLALVIAWASKKLHREQACPIPSD